MKIINNLLSIIFRFLFLLVLLLVLFFLDIPHAIDVRYENNFLLLLLGCGLFSILYFACIRLCNYISFKTILMFSIIFVILQIYLVSNYYFNVGWDVYTIITKATAEAKGEHIKEFEDYFSVYPNNAFLVFAFSRILRLSYAIGLSDIHAYSVLWILQCFIQCGVGIMIYYCSNLLFDKETALFSYLIYQLIVGLSPWVSVPYSDSVGLLFPISVFSIYLYSPKKKWDRLLKYLSLGFLSFIAYKIKPQCFIIFISMSVIGILNTKRDSLLLKIRNGGYVLSGMLIGIIIVSLCVNSLSLEIDKEKKFSIAHFLAMGMNDQHMGIYCHDDVEYSLSFDNYHEREEADLDLALERIHKMGLLGIAKQVVSKTLTNFSDGTFVWGQEGAFYRKIYVPKNKTVAPFIRSFIYTDGKNYCLWSNFEQAVWLSILFFCIFSVCRRKEVLTLKLTLIGLTIMISIFEARARYLYTCLPLFILVASEGIKNVRKGIIFICKRNSLNKRIITRTE